MAKAKIIWKKTLFFIIILIAAVIGLVCLLLGLYQNIITNRIFHANSEAIEETFREISQTFSEVSSARWNYLYQLSSYFETTNKTDASTLEKHVEELKKRYGFTEFYLLNENGNYITVNGEKGYIDLGKSLFTLMDEGENIVTDGSLPRRDNMIFYAVPVEENSYQDFKYCAVAFGYNKSDISDTLNISAYKGKSTTYLAYANGRVSIVMNEYNLELQNVFSVLKKSDLSEEQIEQIETELKEKKTNTFLVKLENGKEYYFSYQPTGIQDWMLISFTESSNVNQEMNNVRAYTTQMMVISFGVIFVLIVTIILYLFYRTVSKKDTILAERDLIFSLIAQNMDEIYLLVKREDSTVLYASPNVERLLGISIGQVYENGWILRECAEDKVDVLNEEKLRSIKPGESYDSEVTFRNQKTSKKALYSFHLYRPTGRHSNVVVTVISDRTKEVQVRMEIQDALQMAQTANQSKTMFLANMSHDIRTPMNAIVGFATLLERDANNPTKVKEHTRKIQSSSRHLLNLINDVLDMSKIESGKATLQLEELTIAEVVRDLETIIRPQAAEKNQTFTLVLEIDEEEMVMADRLRLSQILLNILSNAVKYTPNGGVITWKVDRNMLSDGETARYHFLIQDNGIGMSEEYQSTIFDSFTREIGSMTNKIQGTGLGMAITKNLVDLMGGTIQLTSRQNEGSTFEVLLDLKVTHRETTEASEQEVNIDFSLEGLHVLAAEDNFLNAEILGEFLEMEGIVCDIVENGKEAVDAFAADTDGTYDLILMDIQMPVMNGYEATRAIRSSEHERASTIPIIAMTANTFSEDVQNALACGMNAHLAKPIDIETLKSTMAKVLATSTKIQ